MKKNPNLSFKKLIFCPKVFFKSAWGKNFIIFAALSFLIRVVFFFLERAEINLSATVFLKSFGLGLFFDLLTLSYIAIVPLTYYTFVSNKFFNSRGHQKANRVFYFLFLFLIVFSAFSEVVFWDEFQTRFNFIAVDYLIYTTEVIANIVESYPMTLLIGSISLISGAIFAFTHKKVVQVKEEKFFCRFKKFICFAAFLTAMFFAVDSSKLTRVSDNNYVNEIASNGIYQLFSAYRNNQIDYDQLYVTKDPRVALENLRASISKQEPRSEFLGDDDISRFIPRPRAGEEKRYNIMFVAMESFSAEFMKAFGNNENISPNLDELAKNGLLFTNMKATGTRTVRGLEALSLSIPPTPGNSIVRRPNNENLFNISSPLKDRGYEAKFIYGGDGYFDNMNYFFRNNGFEIVDRSDFAKDEISFSNAWGVSDEDLYLKAIKEADNSYSKNKPFLNFLMTTSNHRPFTYPEGKIDIAPKTGRNGAVKFADYAVGRLIEEAKKKPWFDNTIFIFVADHCAGSAGNTDLPLWRYQIPAIFYAPKIIKPQVFDKNVSQIDIAPTLFGVMNLGYKSKFFGTDIVTNVATIDQHAFVSTYSDIGYFEEDKLYLLKPKKEKKISDVKLNKFGWNGSTETAAQDYEEEELDEVIAYYESASHFFKNGKLKNFTKDKKN
jgi:phosphoglycerol transferase MdoB-like AlkP superfamily enzyme